MPLSFEEKYNQCVLKARKFIEEIQQIDESLKVVVVVENGQISLIQTSSEAWNLAEPIGVLRISQVRMEEQEKRLFARRMDVTEMMNRLSQEVVEKEKLN